MRRLVPAPLAPADRDSAAEWARATLPPRQTAIRFRWRYRDERVSYAGRGMTRIAPPDSLRFDYAGPLGLGAGAAVVLGDTVVWADPKTNFRSLVPAIPMLWASLGMVRPPAAEAVVYGRTEGPRQLWRFVHGADTLDYVATAGAPGRLEAEWRRGGSVVARSRTEYDTHAMPASARIVFPEGPARFDLTVVAVDTLAVITPALWRSRR
ncbi:MAG: hypothetical protein HYS40_05575 [Gemmatimonadetes bacterium]|nr:hypothetical protein [Gemmatimonadota bacterium]